MGRGQPHKRLGELFSPGDGAPSFRFRFTTQSSRALKNPQRILKNPQESSKKPSKKPQRIPIHSTFTDLTYLLQSVDQAPPMLIYPCVHGRSRAVSERFQSGFRANSGQVSVQCGWIPGAVLLRVTSDPSGAIPGQFQHRSEEEEEGEEEGEEEEKEEEEEEEEEGGGVIRTSH